MNNAETTFDLVCSYLREMGYTFSACEESASADLTIIGRTSLLNIRVRVSNDPLLVLILVRMPTVVPDERRAQVAEVVARANYGMMVGCFDYNMSDGMLGYRVSLPLVDAAVTPEQFGAAWRTAFATADHYHRAFCRLLYGDDLSPAEVVAEVEMAEK